MDSGPIDCVECNTALASIAKGELCPRCKRPAEDSARDELRRPLPKKYVVQVISGLRIMVVGVIFAVVCSAAGFMLLGVITSTFAWVPMGYCIYALGRWTWLGGRCKCPVLADTLEVKIAQRLALASVFVCFAMSVLLLVFVHSQKNSVFQMWLMWALALTVLFEVLVHVIQARWCRKWGNVLGDVIRRKSIRPEYGVIAVGLTWLAWTAMALVSGVDLSSGRQGGALVLLVLASVIYAIWHVITLLDFLDAFKHKRCLDLPAGKVLTPPPPPPAPVPVAKEKPQPRESMPDTIEDESLCCVGCGYSLYLQPSKGLCPECGGKVEDAWHSGLLARSGVSYQRRLQWGFRATCWGFWLAILSIPVMLLGILVESHFCAVISASMAGASIVSKPLGRVIWMGKPVSCGYDRLFAMPSRIAARVCALIVLGLFLLGLLAFFAAVATRQEAFAEIGVLLLCAAYVVEAVSCVSMWHWWDAHWLPSLGMDRKSDLPLALGPWLVAILLGVLCFAGLLSVLGMALHSQAIGILSGLISLIGMFLLATYAVAEVCQFYSMRRYFKRSIKAG